MCEPGTRDGMVFRFPRGLVAVSFSMLSPFQWSLGFRGKKTALLLTLRQVLLSSHSSVFPQRNEHQQLTCSLIGRPHP
jgi:hypothetical protein